EPGAIGLLLPPQVRDGALERGSILRPACARQRRRYPRGDVARRRIEQRAVIRERNVVEVVVGVVSVERGEPAVLALHGDQPVERTLDRAGITLRQTRLMHAPGDNG